MLFELRNGVPDVSARWQGARDLFLAGKTREAWQLACELRREPGLELAADYLLNAEIARGCSATSTYFALVRRAIRDFPDDPLLQLYYGRVQIARHRYMDAIGYLQEKESTLGETHRTLWSTQLASIFGDAGFGASCRRYLKVAASADDFDHPLALYNRANAAEGLLQWDEAIELLERCVGVTPKWAKATVFLVHCLLARGRISDAEERLKAIEASGVEDANTDVAFATLALSLARFDEAIERLEQLLVRWPQAEFHTWVRRSLVILLVEMGTLDRAREVCNGEEKKLALPPIPQTRRGGHQLIPLPLVAQNRDQCVPTCVAMAAWPQGHKLNADTLFREMHGRDGTALWRMRDWLVSRGFECIPIRVEREAITALLELKIPLIGVLEGVFNSHVEVLCGYCEDLDVLYVRDPAHWILTAWPWDLALPRYEMWGGVVAVVDQRNTHACEVARRFHAPECDALMDLGQSIFQGDFASAEAAFDRIDAAHPSAFMRDSFSVSTVISPDEFERRMKEIAGSTQAPPVARFRALHAVDEEALKVFLADEEQEGSLVADLGVSGRRYMRLRQLMIEGEWETALRVVDQLLVTGGNVAAFWEYRSDILAQLGRHVESEQSLDFAMELEPLRVSLREKALSRSADHLTYDEYEKKLEELLREDDDRRSLLHAQSRLLSEGPDGLAYERSVRELIRWFPRYPNSYRELAWWFFQQGRTDLQREVELAAREKLPSLFDSEHEEPESSTESESESDREATVEQDPKPKENPTEALPEGTAELLELAGLPADERVDRALEELVKRQRAGKLDWYEQASLLAIRLSALAATPDPGKQTDRLLPRHVPGAPHWYVRVVCDRLTDGEVVPIVARKVNSWLKRIVPEYRNHSELWFLRVLLFEYALLPERAFGELEGLLERYPAHASALYRMGWIRAKQGDLVSAREWLGKSLEANPGLYGAMDLYRRVSESLEDPGGILEGSRMLWRKFPYSLTHLRNVAFDTCAVHSLDEGLQVLQSLSDRFPPLWLDTIRAHLFADFGELSRARELLDEIELDDDEPVEDLVESHLRASLAVVLREGDPRRIVECCEQGLQRWPDGPLLAELRARHSASWDRDGAIEGLREFIAQRSPRAQTIGTYFSLVDQPADLAARQLVVAAGDERGRELAELIAEVIGEPDWADRQGAFLEWAVARFPQSDSLAWEMAMYCNAVGENTHAVEHASRLHERRRNDPGVMRLLGRCWIDVEPEKGLPFLEAACNQDRSVDFLFDLARCCHAVGNQERARELHWEILQQNPLATSSWTNIFLYQNDDPQKLWPYVNPMLEAESGVSSEYFLVAAVMIAVDLKQVLSPAWHLLALQRWKLLQVYPPFYDERERLQAALLAWQSRRRKIVPRADRIPFQLVPWWKAIFSWPKRSWIPPVE